MAKTPAAVLDVDFEVHETARRLRVDSDVARLDALRVGAFDRYRSPSTSFSDGA